MFYVMLIFFEPGKEYETSTATKTPINNPVFSSAHLKRPQIVKTNGAEPVIIRTKSILIFLIKLRTNFKDGSFHHRLH